MTIKDYQRLSKSLVTNELRNRLRLQDPIWTDGLEVVQEILAELEVA